MKLPLEVLGLALLFFVWTLWLLRRKASNTHRLWDVAERPADPEETQHPSPRCAEQPSTPAKESPPNSPAGFG
jgi:hypothetical protein